MLTLSMLFERQYRLIEIHVQYSTYITSQRNSASVIELNKCWPHLLYMVYNIIYFNILEHVPWVFWNVGCGLHMYGYSVDRIVRQPSPPLHTHTHTGTHTQAHTHTHTHAHTHTHTHIVVVRPGMRCMVECHFPTV